MKKLFLILASFMIFTAAIAEEVYICTGSFLSLEKAEIVEKKLNENSLNAFISLYENKKSGKVQTFYRVLVKTECKNQKEIENFKSSLYFNKAIKELKLKDFWRCKEINPFVKKTVEEKTEEVKEIKEETFIEENVYEEKSSVIEEASLVEEVPVIEETTIEEAPVEEEKSAEETPPLEELPLIEGNVYDEEIPAEENIIEESLSEENTLTDEDFFEEENVYDESPLEETEENPVVEENIFEEKEEELPLVEESIIEEIMPSESSEEDNTVSEDLPLEENYEKESRVEEKSDSVVEYEASPSEYALTVYEEEVPVISKEAHIEFELQSTPGNVK